MTDEQVANIITVAAVFSGMFIALVMGYIVGYQDGKKEAGKTV